MSRSASDRPRPFVLIANPGTRRARSFQAALQTLGRPPARVVAYADLLAGRVALPDVVPASACVRIESPDREFEVERAILALGAADAADEGTEHLGEEDVARLDFEPGRILPSRQWYLGYRAVLGLIRRQLAASRPCALMADPDDVLVMFDKPACHARLSRRGLPVAPALEPIGGFEEMVERMAARGWRRVFVKPAHGASASGVVAYQTNGREHVATTTVEIAREGGRLRLYNSRRLRVYRDRADIAALVDHLAGQRLHVERWLPKAGIDGRTFDLRVLVVAGRVKHVVARLSHGPMTNLHLDNAREGPERVRARMGPEHWDAAVRTCEATMGCFPASLYGGIDLLVGTDFRSHAVLEINAFGDLLLDTFCDGLDPYACEILAVAERDAARAAPSGVAAC